ncbi:glutathione peroxidase [Flavivirga aquatica]|uniref:Glutathione peroxidase n=1 Tax=Flavivirga aquatica TaxID=1849968 RepID=A0A1E5SHE3_9FLAO|nr:glutathione peroxidase [Flavivirga aquatica]OEJ98541.1 glutathione peroxidase [Flavivirga aquatica]
MNSFLASLATLFSRNDKPQISETSIYDIKISTLKGQPIKLSQFKGKYILFVNVASKCGFTPQYKNLQELHTKYKDKLQVIGLPCNQFGNQEPEKLSVIESFCEINYGVNFLITEKIDVKGNNKHQLYSWLTQKINNRQFDSSVKWNFQKYLVDTNGNLIDYYFSITNPLSSKITKHLK